MKSSLDKFKNEKLSVNQQKLVTGGDYKKVKCLEDDANSQKETIWEAFVDMFTPTTSTSGPDYIVDENNVKCAGSK